MSKHIIWKHPARERLIVPMRLMYERGFELSRVIRVRYEKGVLKPLEPVNLREGEELVISIRKRKVSDVLDRYVGLFGKADVEELKRCEEEAQAQ